MKDYWVGRVCHRCGNSNTCNNFGGNPLWYRYIDEKDSWDGRSYLCCKCYTHIRRHGFSEKPEKICCECGSRDTYVYNDYSAWHNHKCDKKCCTKYLCHKCYTRNYQKNDPYSQNNIMKRILPCRTENIYVKSFDRLSDNDKGRIGEDIVAITLGLENQNDKSNNYCSPFDLTIHPKYGRIQVKIRSLNVIENFWDFNVGIGEFDTLFVVCMDHYRPWKIVERVYAIPYDNVCYLTRGSTIPKNTFSKESKWEEFRIDENPFVNTYHNILTYIKRVHKR